MHFPHLLESNYPLLTTFLLILIFLPKLWDSIMYQFKICFIYFSFFMATVHTLPVAIFLPGNRHNVDTAGCIMKKYCSWLFAKVHLRGAVEQVPKLGGGVVVMNHQHLMDAVATCAGFPTFVKATFIAKSSIKWILFLSKLCGCYFVDRKAGSEAHAMILTAVDDLKNENAKLIIYPEGTRNFYSMKTKCFLPFKKGPFRAAINAQVPVIPVVISPYYFIVEDLNIFERGDIIVEVMEPVSTQGLNEKDTDLLLNKVHKLMIEKYRQLHDEMISKLPPNSHVHKFLSDTDTKTENEEINQ